MPSQPDMPTSFILEIPAGVSHTEYQTLIQDLKAIEGLNIAEEEQRGIEEIIPYAVTIYLALDQGINLVTGGVDKLDQWKKKVDKAAKTIYDWRNYGDVKAKQAVKVTSAKNRSKKKILDSPDGKAIIELNDE